MITVRNAIENDIKKINELLYQVQQIHHQVRPDLFKKGTKKYTTEEIKKILLDKTKPIFVIVDDNEICGYAFCIIEEKNSSTLQKIKTLYIDDLCVDITKRSKHYGTKLYEYVLNYAKEINCYNVTLNVWADNLDALAFYQHIGMKVQKIGMEKIL